MPFIVITMSNDVPSADSTVKVSVAVSPVDKYSTAEFAMS
ncbi:hypothetical protein JCM19239_2684 [Vibrio variabilis]|uniref:Uncharacterized protein n=1 Tax=Vibrio variabilis TaxID=990271 RepID=A0ABQ0JLD5_9VIBR|nr:hypothetical protein JCM19239_2684 [Vibrio variabilis]